MEPGPLAKFFARRHSAGSEEPGESDGSVERPAQVRRLSPLVREPTHSSSPASGTSSLAAFFTKRSAGGTSGASSSSYDRPLHRPGGRVDGVPDRLAARGPENTPAATDTPVRMVCSESDASNVDSDDSFEDDDLEDMVDDVLVVEEHDTARSGPPKKGTRLWDGSKVHPRGPRQWHSTPNCAAACDYVCPCGNNCLHHVGGAVPMYLHRREIRRRAKEKGKGGLRDGLREILERHFDRRTRTFMATFLVAERVNVCLRAFGVAAGVSECTFANAVADVTKERPTHAGRVTHRERRNSQAWEALDAWILEMRSMMEGEKMGERPRWYSGKVTHPTDHPTTADDHPECPACHHLCSPPVLTTRARFAGHQERVVVAVHQVMRRGAAAHTGVGAYSMAGVEDAHGDYGHPTDRPRCVPLLPFDPVPPSCP